MSTIIDIPNWQNMPGQQLYNFAAANPSTAEPIQAASLQEWMRLNSLYKINRSGVAVGAIPDLVDNVALPEEMRERIEGMLSQFRENSQSPIRTDASEYAPLLAVLMAIVTVSAEALAAFYALGGGRRYPLFASAEAASAAKAAALLGVQKAQLEATAVAALQSYRVALAAWDGTGNPPTLGAV